MRQDQDRVSTSDTAAGRCRLAWLAGLAVAVAALAGPAAAAPPHAARAVAGQEQAAGHASAAERGGAGARVTLVDGWRGGPGPRGWGPGPHGGYGRPYYGRGPAYGRGWYGGGWYGPGWGGWYGAAPIVVAPRVVVVQPWSPAWYRSCRVRYRSFDPRTGYYVVGGGRRAFCR